MLASMIPAVQAIADPDQEEMENYGTPPRLSLIDGQVSYWRPGAEDWVEAQINTPLASGDQIFVGSAGRMELEVGPRAYVRGSVNTQVGLENQEPDFLQFRLTQGNVCIDLRALDPGRTVEIDTPNAAVTIQREGYYRVAVDGDRTSLVVRRSGKGTVTSSTGQALDVSSSQEVVVEGAETPQISSYIAPGIDDWDKWNYSRTDSLAAGASSRYVPPGTYGVNDLDRYGSWRATPTYGSVWVPSDVRSGWTPYSTGAWVMDPSTAGPGLIPRRGDGLPITTGAGCSSMGTGAGHRDRW